MPQPDLLSLIGKKDIYAIAGCLDELELPLAVAELNSKFSTRRLIKLSRKVEPLPTEKKLLSSYRTRLGTILEYALSTCLDNAFFQKYGDALKLTFASAHDYPDFFIRDKDNNIVLKVEMKAVDVESEEQAARFDVLAQTIDKNRDLLLFIGWKWQKTVSGKTELEYPHVFTHLVVPAIEIANERDRRLTETGGKIVRGKVLVPAKKGGRKFTDDPGNYGKLHRIIHGSRKNDRLSDSMEKFRKFLLSIEDEFKKG